MDTVGRVDAVPYRGGRDTAWVYHGFMIIDVNPMVSDRLGRCR